MAFLAETDLPCLVVMLAGREPERRSAKAQENHLAMPFGNLGV